MSNSDFFPILLEKKINNIYKIYIERVGVFFSEFCHIKSYIKKLYICQ